MLTNHPKQVLSEETKYKLESKIPKYLSENIFLMKHPNTESTRHKCHACTAQRGKVALSSKSRGFTQRCLLLFHTTVLYEFERQCLYLLSAMEQCYT